jgi:hypothetical protein
LANGENWFVKFADRRIAAWGMQPRKGNGMKVGMPRPAALAMILIITIPTFLVGCDRGKQANAPPMPSVEGHLTNEQRAPVVGVEVYLLRKKAGIVIWEHNAKNEIVNSHAKTDQQGRFAIPLPSDYRQPAPMLGCRASDNSNEQYAAGYTLLVWRDKDDFKELTDDKGRYLLFDITGDGVTSVGGLNADKAIGPPTTAVRSPDGIRAYGGSVVFDHTQ